MTTTAMSAVPDTSARETPDTPDSLRDDTAWERAFQEMNEILLARLDRACDWQALYNDPLIVERIETWRKVRTVTILFRALNCRTEDGCRTIWNLREEIRSLQKDENLWYALRMLHFVSPCVVSFSFMCMMLTYITSGGLLHRA